MSNKKISYAIDAVFIALIFALEILFFRYVLPIDNLIGNKFDARLNTVFVEHWYRVFQGKESITDVCGMFYPSEDVLAYSDMMFGYGIIHSILRTLGMNMYMPLKILILTTHVFGSYSLYYLMRKCLKKSSVASLLAVVIFSFSIYYCYCSSNVQFFLFSMVPFILIMMCKWYENRDSKKRFIFAAIGIITYVSLFYTAFYVGYFSSICFGVFFVVMFIYYCISKKGFIRRFKKYILEILIYLIAVLALMIPFVIIYLPAFKQSSGRRWEKVYWSLPDIIDLVTVYNQNDGGLSLFYRIIIVVIIVLTIVYIVKCVIKKKFNTTINILIISSILLFVMFDRIGEVTLWHVMYYIVPGAKAVRALFRAQIIVHLIYALLLGYLVDEIIRSKLIAGTVIGLGITAVFGYGCIYNHAVASDWSISSVEYIEDVSEPPHDCEVIYISRQMRSNESDMKTNLDAITIAMKYNLRTVNGYSGLTPTNWDIDYDEVEIDSAVADWCNYSGIDKSKVYGYDFQANSWKRL